MIETLGWCFVGELALLALVAIGFIVVAFVGRIRDGTKSRREKWHRDGREYQRSLLMSDSWWLSEDPVTMRLVQDLASGRDIASVRDAWRSERSSKAEEEVS